MLMDDSNRLRDAQGDFSGLPGLTVAQLRNIGEAALRGSHYNRSNPSVPSGAGESQNAEIQGL
jgi:hypothetical protein